MEASIPRRITLTVLLMVHVTIVSIDSYEDVNSYDELALKKAVANQPVSVAIEGGGREFQLYSSSVVVVLRVGGAVDIGQGRRWSQKAFRDWLSGGALPCAVSLCILKTITTFRTMVKWWRTSKCCFTVHLKNHNHTSKYGSVVAHFELRFLCLWSLVFVVPMCWWSLVVEWWSGLNSSSEQLSSAFEGSLTFKHRLRVTVFRNMVEREFFFILREANRLHANGQKDNMEKLEVQGEYLEVQRQF
ncbi:hypothetical protein V8G54_005084 [Vigna mungo]|uniref:Peptidase C1A papain C-terminal domain-containing protein n=1 Tax=Vigna mungo TaxID=3915 RepID=A0AAQ3PJL2_VIGMU